MTARRKPVQAMLDRLLHPGELPDAAQIGPALVPFQNERLVKALVLQQQFEKRRTHKATPLNNQVAQSGMSGADEYCGVLPVQIAPVLPDAVRHHDHLKAIARGARPAKVELD